ncbi:serine hydrolase domain-containing protein [Chryseobacterium paludis]|uniref:serine hydrolase domain-containing protein n=1 Tax=Chryseobacterium paludis TaxID=2956784 RepID=UPI0021C16557|nr:serine hydrolase domain-containing protein [Chryseobacterium paludis]
MKSHIKLALCIFFLMGFGLGLYSSQFTPKNEIRKADSLLNTYAKANAPGMAIGIIKDGKVIYKKTYGQANLEDQISVTDSTAFNIASVSKQFTALVALMAVKEGKLSLDDDIRNYLPELSSLPYKISVRQLANHTHGLPNFTEINELQGFGDEFRLTNNEAVQTVLGIKSINYTPGEQYQYNNTGFMLLAEILRRVYKKDFAQILKEFIFNPLGMKHSVAIDDPEKIIPNKAEPYLQKGNIFLKFPIGQMVYGASNIYITLNDLCTWAINFQKPTVGSRELFNTMQKNTILNNGSHIEYGLGLQTGTYKGLNLVFHGGGTAGYCSYILHIPSQNFSLVVLGNKRAFDGFLIAYQLIDLFLANKLTPDIRPQKTTYTPSELKNFEGVYELSPGNYLEISADGKDLYVGTYNHKGKEVLPGVGDGKFNITSIPTASLTFNGGLVTFRIGDFTYTAKRVTLNPPKAETMDLKQFVGFYRNDEFNTTYQLVIENNNLVAKHPINGDIPVFPLKQMSFNSTQSYFGQLDFKVGKEGDISGFMLSGSNLVNIEFKKIN